MRIAIVSFFFVLSVINVYATEKANEILRVVMNADGYINEQLYNVYWKQFKVKPSSSELTKIKRISTVAIQNQYHIWSAAKLSAKNKKIIRTIEFENAIRYMKEIGDSKAIENTNMLLDAAAHGTPMEIRGEKLYITEDLCDEIVAGLNASIERVNILLSKSWKPTVKERKLTSYLSVLSSMPFIEKTVNINNIIQKQYSLKLDEENRQVIAIMDNQRSDTSESTDDCIKGISESVGMNAKLIRKNTFLGNQASSISLVLKDNSNKTYLEAMCVNYDKHLVSVMTISSGLLEASNYHDLLLKNIQLR